MILSMDCGDNLEQFLASETVHARVNGCADSNGVVSLSVSSL